MRSPALAIPLALLLLVAPARAQDSDPERLFAEATALIEQEKYAEAIVKLEEAQRRDPGVGTQFNLAVCYAKVGRLALAWRNFGEVEMLARASGKKQREESARAQMDSLRPRLSYGTIRVDESAPVTVRVDGEVVPPRALAFVPLDPGEHVIEAVAAAKKPFESRFKIDGEAERHEVVVPALEIIESKTRVVTRETTNTRRTLAYVFGGLGAAGVATATVTGIMILSDKSTAKERCTPECVDANGAFDQTGADAVQRGKTLLPINAIAWGVAAAGLGGGAFFFFTQPSKKAAPVAILPVLGPREASASITTSF